MPDLRPIGHACSSMLVMIILKSGMLAFNQPCWRSMRHVGLQSGMLVFDMIPIRNVGLQWVFDQPCRCPKWQVGLPWVSYQTCWYPMDLGWVSERFPIIIILTYINIVLKPLKKIKTKYDVFEVFFKHGTRCAFS